MREGHAIVGGNRRVGQQRAQRIAGGTSTTSSSVARIDARHAQAPRERARELGAVEQRIGIGPFLSRVAEALRRLRRPQRMPQLPQDGSVDRVDLRGVERAQHGDQPVLRRAELPRVRRSTPRADRRARATTARRSPSVSRNTRAMRSTAAAGGSSRDEVRHELRRDEARRGRVAAQRRGSTRSPCADAVSLYCTPSTVFAPGLVQQRS